MKKKNGGKVEKTLVKEADWQLCSYYYFYAILMNFDLRYKIKWMLCGKFCLLWSFIVLYHWLLSKSVGINSLHCIQSKNQMLQTINFPFSITFSADRILESEQLKTKSGWKKTLTDNFLFTIMNEYSNPSTFLYFGFYFYLLTLQMEVEYTITVMKQKINTTSMKWIS